MEWMCAASVGLSPGRKPAVRRGSLPADRQAHGRKAETQPSQPQKDKLQTEQDFTEKKQGSGVGVHICNISTTHIQNRRQEDHSKFKVNVGLSSKN